ncbi:MAG: hypothetical protein QNJ58_01330 [Desulfobacterales bacterium]|nr:hypothetical protein [Desulfobacterales bacterium]
MLDMTIFAEYTLQDILTWAGIAIGILVAISILKKIFRPEKVDPYMQTATCSGCGWQGQVSRHAGKCPGCNRPLGDRTINSTPGNDAQIT